MAEVKAPYRYDVVGSFLRPAYLRQARAAFEAGRLAYEDLRKTEDRAITDLVAKEKAAGLRILTDGEFRRLTWHLDFMWNIPGVRRVRSERGNTTFNGESAAIDDVTLEGRLAPAPHPFIDHYRFLKGSEDERTSSKLTIPAPGQFYAQFTGRQELANTLRIYGSKEAFARDVVAVYRAFVERFYAAGGRNLQFDDCTWGGFVNPDMAKALTGLDGTELSAYMRTLVDINNGVIDAQPRDLVVNTHVCRGNYHSTYFSSGPYDAVAPVLFAHERVHAFFLEYDDARSGGFAPLAQVPEDRMVVLGLVTTKRPDLEDEEAVVERIHEAERYVPLERLCLSPQCGFASCEIGNKLTEDEQWAKVRLVRAIASRVWGI